MTRHGYAGRHEGERVCGLMAGATVTCSRGFLALARSHMT